MSDAILGYGTQFQNGDGGSPEIWSTVAAEITNVTPPNPSREAIDVSHEDGPDDWAGSMPGKSSPGQMSIEFNFVPGANDYNDLLAELDDKEIRHRRLVFPNSSVMTFSAFLLSLESEAPIDDRITATATFQLTGQLEPVQ